MNRFIQSQPMRGSLPSSSQRRIGSAVAVLAGAVLFFMLLCNRIPPADGKATVTAIDDDERIVFFPTYASYNAKKNEWVVHVNARFYEREARSTQRKLLRAGIRKLLDVPDNAQTRRRFQSRIDAFLSDSERGKSIVVKLGGRSFRLEKTDKAGLTRTKIRVPADGFAAARSRSNTPGGWVTLQAVLPRNDRRRFSGKVLPVSATGLSVISDIDDTIKVTNVLDRGEMLANTLYRPLRSVRGMPELYRELEKRKAVFHYVSGSPWQLYEPLTQLLTAQRFPRGPLHLRRFRLLDVSSLSDLSEPIGKPAEIESLLAEFPRRRFLLFGDSGERDPEYYGEVARKYPRQIAGVFIRNITSEKRDNQRMSAAFRNVDADRWALFRDPKEVRSRVLKLAGK